VIGEQLLFPPPKKEADPDDDVDDKSLVVGSVICGNLVEAKKAEVTVPRIDKDGRKAEPKREKVVVAEDKDYTDPRDWLPPSQHKDETPEHFAKRFKKWDDLRKHIMKRKGLKPQDGKKAVGKLGAGAKKGDGPNCQFCQHPMRHQWQAYGQGRGAQACGCFDVEDVYLYESVAAELCQGEVAPHSSEILQLTTNNMNTKQLVQAIISLLHSVPLEDLPRVISKIQKAAATRLNEFVEAQPVHGQDAIGMLGAGASKGDGPLTRAQRARRAAARRGAAPVAAPAPQQRLVRRRARRARVRANRRQRGGAQGPEFLGPSGPGFPNLAGKGVTRNMTTNRRERREVNDEYIAEVTVASEPAFNNVVYSVNPGQANTFPWLSRIAQNFEKYRFEYLEFYYKREVSEYATAGQSGKVIFSFDTDASDPAPTTKQQMEDTDPHVDALPSENMTLVVPTNMLHGSTDALYVRSGALPANTDIKTYDVGNLNVATTGITSNVAVGELHVRYVCVLSVPVLEGVGASNAMGAMITTTGTTASPLLAGVATGAITISQSLTTVTFTGLAVGSEYGVIYSASGGVASSNTAAWSAWSGATLKTNLTYASATGGIAFVTITATAAIASATMTIAGTPNAGTESCFIFLISPALSV